MTKWSKVILLIGVCVLSLYSTRVFAATEYLTADTVCNMTNEEFEEYKKKPPGRSLIVTSVITEVEFKTEQINLTVELDFRREYKKSKKRPMNCNAIGTIVSYPNEFGFGALQYIFGGNLYKNTIGVVQVLNYHKKADDYWLYWKTGSGCRFTGNPECNFDFVLAPKGNFYFTDKE